MAGSFQALDPGGVLFFRLKHPVNRIAGYGYFITFDLLPIREAWMTFQDRNGDPNVEGFVGRIAGYRRESPSETLLTPKPIGCIVLRNVHFFPEDQWLSWGSDEGWSPNIVAFTGYELGVGPGLLLQGLMHNGRPAELSPAFEFVGADGRTRAETLAVAREGQGAFRLRVLDAYDRRCAVTGERSLPVLDAAHIQSYLGPESNHVQNGLSLRADIHRLFDEGYVTVTPDLRFEVSRRLKEEFQNGKEYYALDGQKLLYLPSRGDERPSEVALEWHANNVYRG